MKFKIAENSMISRVLRYCLTTDLQFAILASSNSRRAYKLKGKVMMYTATIFVDNEALQNRVGFNYKTNYFFKMHDAQAYAVKELKKSKYKKAHANVFVIVEKIEPDERYVARYSRHPMCITRNEVPVEWF